MILLWVLGLLGAAVAGRALSAPKGTTVGAVRPRARVVTKRPVPNAAAKARAAQITNRIRAAARAAALRAKHTQPPAASDSGGGGGGGGPSDNGSSASPGAAEQSEAPDEQEPDAPEAEAEDSGDDTGQEVPVAGMYWNGKTLS